MNKYRIRIAIAEDNDLLRDTLIAFLKNEPDFLVAAEARNGKELLEQLKKVSVDVVVLDIEMPVMGGRATMEVIKKRFSETRIIILSNHSQTSMITDFMSGGANSFLSKNCDAHTLVRAIKSVHAEGYFFDKSLSRALLGTIMRDRAPNDLRDDVDFSDREKQIIKMIWLGKNNREIASDLNVSSSTVDAARGKIYSKTNCNTAIELIRFALKKGVISVQD